MRVRPVRRTAAGEVDLRAILDGLDHSLLAAVQTAMSGAAGGAAVAPPGTGGS